MFMPSFMHVFMAKFMFMLISAGLDQHISVGRLADIPERATRGGWVFDGAPDPITGARDLW